MFYFTKPTGSMYAGKKLLQPPPVVRFPIDAPLRLAFIADLHVRRQALFMAETAAEVVAGLKPDGVRIYPTVIVRDTALYDLWRSGRYQEHTVEDAVRCCAKLLPVFEEAGIPVIRLGLNPTEALSAGEAAAGAYHPALGELVYGRIFREEAERQIREGRMDGAAVEILVPPGRASFMAGQKRCNTLYLQQKFGLRRIVIRENAGSGGVTVKKIAK